MDAPLQAFDVVAQIIHTGHCTMFWLKKLPPPGGPGQCISAGFPLLAVYTGILDKTGYTRSDM